MSSRVVCLLVGVFLLSCLGGSLALAQHPYPHNGIFLSHEMVSNPKKWKDANITEMVLWMQARDIEYQLHNIGMMAADGTISYGNYDNLANWVRVTNDVDPNQKVVAYISGNKTDHVLGGSGVHQNIADTVLDFFVTEGVDAVNLDFEPFLSDSPEYLDLFSTIRSTVGSSRHLSLDCSFSTVWSPDFLYQVSTYFDWLCPMLYDTDAQPFFCDDAECYQDIVRQSMHHYADNLASNCELYALIPTKERQTPDETFTNALAGIEAAIGEGADMHSLGVWWYWGWGTEDEQMWTDSWLNRYSVAPVADFTVDQWAGPAPFTAQFRDRSTFDPQSWDWTFGDGGTSTARNPSHVYAAGTYTVSLTAANSYGQDTEIKTDYIQSGTEPSTVYIYPTSVVFDAGSTVSGDLSDLQQEDSARMVTQCDPGSLGYDVTYSGTSSLTPADVAKITMEFKNKSSEVLAPYGVLHIRDSGGSIPWVEEHTWTTTDHWYKWYSNDASDWMSGDGTVGFRLWALPDIGYTVSDVWTYSADVLRWRIDLVSVSGPPPPPVADFSGNPTSGDAPLTVQFTDLSSGSPTSWDWTFGDTGTATAQNPSHQYTSVDLYTVSLTAANAQGQDTETKPDYIDVTEPSQNPPVADFSGSPTSGPAPLNVDFTDLSTNSPTSWDWTFGDGGTDTVQHPSHTYAEGTYTVSLTAANQYGQDTETKNNYITATGGGGGDYFADSAEITKGNYTSGSYTDTHSSNDVYWVIRPGKLGPRYTDFETYTFNTGLSGLSSLSVTVEGKVETGSEPQNIYVYNYSTSDWDVVDTSTLATTDSTVNPTVSNPANCISGGTVQVRVKVGDDDGTNYLNHYTDLVKITAQP